MSTRQEDVVLRREQLYEQVWAEPVTKVAQRHQVSDVALAKACRRLGVPLPPRGYWAEIAGQTPKKPPLPARRADRPAEYGIDRYRQPGAGAMVEGTLSTLRRQKPWCRRLRSSWPRICLRRIRSFA